MSTRRVMAQVSRVVTRGLVLVGLVAGLLAAVPAGPAGATVPSAPAPVNPAPWFSAVTSSGPTQVSGHLSADTVWGPQGSPYVVSGQFVVDTGVSLTVLPGTVVKMTDTNADIVVWGQLLVLGTPEDRVKVTSLKDDSVMGDTNGDGDATSPDRGDWGGIDIYSSQGGAPERQVSLIDYADIRYGGDGPTTLCQYGLVNAKTEGPRFAVTNSRLTDSEGAGLTVTELGPGGFVGAYNNEFSESECGVGSNGGSGDIVGNEFRSPFNKAAFFGTSPKGIRFWYNLVEGPIVSGLSGTSTASDFDVKFNNAPGGVDNFGVQNQQFHAYGPNWWGSDLNAPLPECLTLADVNAIRPKVTYVVDDTCPPDRKYKPTGYAAGLTPAMSGPPPSIPASLLRQAAPTFGPVNTGDGTLTYAAEDMVVTDASKQLAATRTYVSRRPGDSDVGKGWRTSFTEQMGSAGSIPVMSFADGSTVPFDQDVAAGFTPAPGVSASYGSGTAGTSVTTPDRTTYEFDTAGQLKSLLLADPGHKVDVDHVDGKLSKVTGSSGRELRYDRGTGGRLDSVTDSQGREVTYDYDPDGRLVTATGVDGNADHYEYTGSRLTKVTSSTGVVKLAVGYDGDNRVEWVEQQGTGRATIDYDGDLRTITLADGTHIDQQLDAKGRLVEERVRGRAARHVVYDGEGRVVSEVAGVPDAPMAGYSALAGATFFDKSGHPVRQVDPIGRATVTTYNAKHDPLTVKDQRGAVTSYTYDPVGRAEKVTDPLGNDWQFDYNSRGQTTKVEDPLGRTRELTYQSDGDPSTTTDEYGGVTETTTDSHGWVTAVTDPLDRTTGYTYTSWGQVKSIERPRGGTQTATFNADRDVSKITDAKGGETTYGYDDDGRLETVTDDAGGVTTTTYDDLGRPDTVTDVRDQEFSQNYTPEGWPTTVEGPGGVTTSTSYDPAGRAVRRTDQLGNVTQDVLNRAGQVVTHQTPDGASATYTYDAAGNQTRTVDPLGKTWTSTYDLADNLKSTTDALTKVTTRSYDPVGRMTSVTDPNSVTTSYAYDDANRKVTISDPVGVVSVSYFDAAGQTTRVTDGEGGDTDYAYNDDGLPTKQTSPTGGEKTYTYNTAGELTAQADELGHEITATYNSLGRVTARSFPDDSTEAFAYDAAGNLTQRTDRRDNDWAYTYDAYNRVKTAKDPLDATTTYAYDAAGRNTKITDPTGIETRTAYDPMGRPAVVSDPSDASTVTTYDLAGRPKTLTDPAGVVTTNSYDNNGQLIATALSSGPTTNFTYDPAGNQLTKKISGTQTFKQQYDQRNRPAASTDALNKTSTTAYDDANRPTSRTTPNGHETTWTYDAAGRTKTATDPLDNTSSYTYDAKGQLTGLELPRGGDYSFGYDADGNRTSETNPIDQTTTYGYDADGHQTSRTEPSGTTISSSWDAAGRQTAQTAGTTSRTFTYDDAGRMLTANTTGHNVTMTYDARGLLATSTDDQGQTTYGYDSAARIASIALPTGDTSTYSYNGFGSVAGIRGPTNLNFSYRSDGRLSGLTNVTGTTNAAQTFAYDLNGRPTSAVAGGMTQTATYNDDGQTATSTRTITSVTNPAEGTNTLTYDDAGRQTSTTLTSGSTTVSTQNTTWDDDGNRASVQDGTNPAVTATYDAADRLTGTSDGTSYTYDDDGQLTSIDRPSGPDTTYAYNAFGELTSTTQGSTTVAVARDALGRVTSRNDATTPTSYGYAGASNTPTVVGHGASAATSLIRDPSDRLLAAKTSTTVQHTAENLHGDLSGYRNNSNGAYTHTALYDPFGNATTTGAESNLLGFQTQLDDPTTGTVDMGARSYDPSTGRFLSEDTVVGDLAAPITLNRYTYANGNPLDYFDADGHFGIPNFIKKVFSAAVGTLKKFSAGVKNVAAAVGRGASSAAAAVSSAATQATKAAAAAAAAVQQAAPAIATDLTGGAKSIATGFSGSLATLANATDSSTIHTALDIAGLVPVIGEAADGTNAVLYLLQGDTKNALISVGAIALGLGSVAVVKRIVSRSGGSLFRGTVEGFAGSPNSQRFAITSASTDPVVATVFAQRASRFGRAVVHIARPQDLRDVDIIGRNVLGEVEDEVGVGLTATDFSERASRTISLATSRTALSRLGVDVPTWISEGSDITQTLHDLPRLTPSQLRKYLRLIGKVQ